MKIRLSGKTDGVFNATVSEEHGLLLGCIKLPSDQVDGFGVGLEVVDATPAELAALQAGGFGRLPGVQELLKATSEPDSDLAAGAV